MKKLFIFLSFLLMQNIHAQFMNQSAFSLDHKKTSEALHSRQDLFEQYKDRIVQVRSINRATEQKGSIGSGFVVGDGRLIATNYHVIAYLVTREGYDADYLDQNFNQGRLKLRAIDVIHDLAILEAEEVIAQPLTFASEDKQGEALFSLGNPSDYGFVIVEGSHNGLQQNTDYSRILFSGALNSGMSGGPTLNQKGEVVGVNVASQGNGLGFIVPVRLLSELLANIEKQKDFNQVVTQQIAADNQRYFQRFFEHDFKKAKLGKRSIPTEFGDDFRCWDNSSEPKEEDLIGEKNLICVTDRQLYLSDDLSMGEFIYQYRHYFTRQDISSSHFYKLYSKRNDMFYKPHSTRYYGDFSCQAEFIRIADEDYKATYCIRPSKKYQGLNDLALTAASINQEKEGFVIQVALIGVQESLGRRVLQRILSQIQ